MFGKSKLKARTVIVYFDGRTPKVVKNARFRLEGNRLLVEALDEQNGWFAHTLINDGSWSSVSCQDESV